MSNDLGDMIDDPSAEALWRMYAKAKASLPYRERMQNLTWRMMGMNQLKNNINHNNESGHSYLNNRPHQNQANDIHTDGSSSYQNDTIQQYGMSTGGDEYLDFDNSSLLQSEKPKMTSNLTKFLLGQQQGTKSSLSEPQTSTNDPTSDDFDYVAHIKKIGQEDSQMPTMDDHPGDVFKSMPGLPIQPHSFSNFHHNNNNNNNNNNGNNINSHEHGSFHSHSVSSSFNTNGFDNIYGSGYLDSPNNDAASFMDPLDAISSSYEAPSSFNNVSSSFNENPSYFQSVYTQSLNSPASSAAQTPTIESGSFLEGYYGGGTGRNNMSFASQMRTVSSTTSFANMSNSVDNGRSSVKMEPNQDIMMVDSSSSQSNLSPAINFRRQSSTASTIKKKPTTSKLTKAKRNSSATQLSNAASLATTSAGSAAATPISSSAPAKKTDTTSTSNANTRCTNCNTQTTPLWRRNPEGQPLCNACGLFLKLHGVVRPLSLKTDVIKKRQRGSSSVSKSGSVQPPSPSKSSVPPTGKKVTTAKTDDKKKAGTSSTNLKKKGSTTASTGGPAKQKQTIPDANFLNDNTMTAIHSHAGTGSGTEGFGFDEDHQMGYQFGSTMDIDHGQDNTGGKQQSNEGGQNNNWEWLTMAL